MKIVNKLSLFALSLFTLCQAHIFEAEKWVNTNTNQQISLLGDYHVAEKEQNQVNRIQQDAIIELAKNIDATIIVEDGRSDGEIYTNPLYYDYNKYRKFDIANPNAVTLLAAFTGRCHEEGVKVNNIEFRFPPLAVSAKTLIEKIELIKAKIEKYTDAQQFTDYYKRKLEELRINVEIPCASLIEQLKKSTANLEDTCGKIRYKPEYDTVLYYFWGHNSFADLYDKINHIVIGYEARLLDLEMLHAIAQCPGHSIVCAGAGHINRIKPALEEIGFTAVHYAGQEHIGHNPEPDALNMTQTLDAFYDANEISMAKRVALPHFVIYVIIVFSILLLVGIVSSMLLLHRKQTQIS